MGFSDEDLAGMCRSVKKVRGLLFFDAIWNRYWAHLMKTLKQQLVL